MFLFFFSAKMFLSLLLSLFFSVFQQHFFQDQTSSFYFVPPGEIQETTIPTTIDEIHSYYTSNERSLEWNRDWHKQMTASGFKCEIHEEVYQFEDEP